MRALVLLLTIAAPVAALAAPLENAWSDGSAPARPVTSSPESGSGAARPGCPNCPIPDGPTASPPPAPRAPTVTIPLALAERIFAQLQRQRDELEMLMSALQQAAQQSQPPAQPGH